MWSRPPRSLPTFPFLSQQASLCLSIGLIDKVPEAALATSSGVATSSAGVFYTGFNTSSSTSARVCVFERVYQHNAVYTGTTLPDSIESSSIRFEHLDFQHTVASGQPAGETTHSHWVIASSARVETSTGVGRKNSCILVLYTGTGASSCNIRCYYLERDLPFSV